MILEATIATTMHFIAVREGFYKRGSLPARHHNPCALVYAGQPAAILGSRGFAWFAKDADGWLACGRDLRKKLVQHRSLHQAWEYLK